MSSADVEATPDATARERIPEFFKFYQEAAERTKSHAWTQSTWLLTFNGAILAFSLNLYLTHASVRGFLFIEWLSALSGLVLCGYVVFVLYELGCHIQTYWTASNRPATQSPLLADYIGSKDAEAAKHSHYRAKFPRFITRLFAPPLLFAVAHLAWAIYVTALTGCA